MADTGKLRLHDAVLPALSAGTYRFDISTDAESTTFSATRWLAVEAPRYRIEEHDLISMHPMPGAEGDFNELLPWVALRRRTLPWERHQIASDPASPWLALVVTQADEARLATGTLEAVVGPAAAAHFESAPSSVAALQFRDAVTLAQIVPSVADARLLCHVREVNQADTELAGTDDDGWLAVVVANRLLTTAARTTWRASLVSLEHRVDIAAGTPATAALIVLASWEFTSTGRGSFQTLVTSLNRAAFGAGEEGVRMSRTDRDGVTKQVRYRSPFEPATSGDDNDVTELAAGELGRLLAAADGRLVRELIQWRRMQALEASRALSEGFVAPRAVSFARALTPATRLPKHLAAAVHALAHVSASRPPLARPGGPVSPEPKVPKEPTP